MIVVHVCFRVDVSLFSKGSIWLEENCKGRNFRGVGDGIGQCLCIYDMVNGRSHEGEEWPRKNGGWRRSEWSLHDAGCGEGLRLR